MSLLKKVNDCQGFIVIVWLLPISIVFLGLSIGLPHWTRDWHEGKWQNTGLWSGCLGERCFKAGEWAEDYVQATRVFIILGCVASLASEVIIIVLFVLNVTNGFIKKLIVGIGTGVAAVFTLIGLAIFVAKKEDGTILEYKIGASFILALIAAFINTVCFGLVFYFEPVIKEKEVDFPVVPEPTPGDWQERTDYEPRYGEPYKVDYNDQSKGGYSSRDYQGDYEYQGEYPSYKGYPQTQYRDDSQV